jgi:hypothetical protein
LWQSIYRWYKYGFIVVFLSIPISYQTRSQESVHTIRLNTDKLLEFYHARKNNYGIVSATEEAIVGSKCGFWIQAQLLDRWNELTPELRVEFSKLMKADIMECDTIAKHFRIFYDTSEASINTPALIDEFNNRIPGTAKAYIDSVARIFNDVWDIEIDSMGYAAPPLETYYSIYVKEISEYGITWPVQQISGSDNPARWHSYIEVQNDFRENQFYSKGINGLKVTAAHEFHHAIQIGSYGYWTDNLFAHELTSTWIEDVVYTDVNDYYYWVSRYFSFFSQGNSFNYYEFPDWGERAIWAHYLMKRFGSDIMRDVWTEMRTQPFLESTNDVLIKKGTSLQSEFALFTYWNYFTWDRADTIKYYPEGNHYPRFLPLKSTTFLGSTSTVRGDVFPLSSSMYEFQLLTDTITAIIANVDVEAALRKENTARSVSVTLSSGELSMPHQVFTNGLKAGFTVENLSLWHSFFMQSSTNADIANAQINASPNPLHLGESEQLLLPIRDLNINVAEVFFFSSSLNLAYTSYWEVKNEKGNRVIVVPTSEIRSKLASGIYFVVAKTANNEYRWKVAVIQ